MHLLAHPEEFRGDSSPTTYLYAIATNKSLSRLRARRVRGDGKTPWPSSFAAPR